MWLCTVQAGNLRTFKLTLEKKRTNAINATLHLHRQANWGHSNSLWRKAQKCKKCDFASVQAHNLRRELKKAYKCNHLQLSIYSGRRFERTSENSLRWKVVQMQSLRLSICSGRRFEKTFENSLRWKSVKMQPMRLCFISGRQFEETVEKSVQVQPFVTFHLFRQAIWVNIWKLPQVKNCSNAVNATMHLYRQAIWGIIWKLP